MPPKAPAANFTPLLKGIIVTFASKSSSTKNPALASALHVSSPLAATRESTIVHASQATCMLIETTDDEADMAFVQRAMSTTRDLP